MAHKKMYCIGLQLLLGEERERESTYVHTSLSHVHCTCFITLFSKSIPHWYSLSIDI